MKYQITPVSALLSTERKVVSMIVVRVSEQTLEETKKVIGANNVFSDVFVSVNRTPEVITIRNPDTLESYVADAHKFIHQLFKKKMPKHLNMFDEVTL